MRITLLALLSLLTVDPINAMIPEHKNLLYGYSGRQGVREEMEDKEVAIYPFEGNSKLGFFAVYDGHGGIEAAEYAAIHLHENLLKNIKSSKKVNDKIFIDTFLETEKGIAGANIPEAGTMAVVSLVEGNTAYLAWVGDSRGIIVRGNKVIAATIDHKPKVEEERLKAAGAQISTRGRVIPGGIDSRVRGGLPVSRVLGDKKDKSYLPPNVLLAIPEIVTTKLQKNDLIVLACDGLWDVFKNDEVAAKVNELLKMTDDQLLKKYQKKSPDQNDKYGSPTGRIEEANEDSNDPHLLYVSRGLRDEAIIKKSGDNVSVLVVQYKEEEKPEPVKAPVAEKPPVPEKAPVVAGQKKEPGVWPESKISNLEFIGGGSKGAKMTILRGGKSVGEYTADKDYEKYPLNKQFKQGDIIYIFDKDKKKVGQYIVSGHHPVLDIIIDLKKEVGGIIPLGLNAKATFVRDLKAVNIPKGVTLTIKKEGERDFGPLSLNEGTFNINIILESTDKMIITGISKTPLEYSPTGDHIVLDLYLDGKNNTLGKIPVVSKK